MNPVESTGQTPQTTEASIPLDGANSGVRVLPKGNTSILACLSKIKDFFKGIFHKTRHVTPNTIKTAGEVSNDSIPENKGKSSLETLFGAPLEDLTDGELFKPGSVFYQLATSSVEKEPLLLERKIGNEKTSSVIKLAKGIKEIWKPKKMTPEANEAM